jgi:hypothetical protein
MDNNILKFEKHPVLGDKELWLYKNALRVDTLTMALAIVRGCSNLEMAIGALQIERDSHAVSSWPGGLRDESTDHQL